MNKKERVFIRQDKISQYDHKIKQIIFEAITKEYRMSPVDKTAQVYGEIMFKIYQMDKLCRLNNKEVKRIKIKNLTKVQIKVYKGAKKFGYFDYPRKITLSKLAKKLSLAPSTVSVHLQKIYSKLIMRRNL